MASLRARAGRQIAAAALLLLGTPAAFAQSTSAEQQPRPTRFLERRIFQGQTLKSYIAQVMVPFRGAVTGPDGLGAPDVALAQRKREAQKRAQFIAEVFRYDLNGDLVVTPDELAAFREVDGRRLPASELERFDVDGDGRVTLKEVLEASARISKVSQTREFDDLADMMQLPQVRDGRLTSAGLQEAARQVFAQADVNGDGRISGEENRRFRALLPPEPVRAEINDIYCPMPAAKPDDLIVLIGSYEGDRPRGAQHSTGTATVHVVPARRGVYLVLPSYEAIRWTVTGAVGRVRHVVLSSYGRGDEVMPRGVDGVPGQIVKVFSSQGCVPGFSKAGTPEAAAADTIVALRLGRRADVVEGAYHATIFEVAGVPSASNPAAPK